MISLICFAGFQSGQSVMLGNCSETCSCAAGVFTCKNSQCKEGQTCGMKNGVMDCYSTGKKCMNNNKTKQIWLYVSTFGCRIMDFVDVLL